MAEEYKVTFDQSMRAENDPKAIEKKMNELAREGWELRQVTSVRSGGGENNVFEFSRIYLFWERENA